MVVRVDARVPAGRGKRRSRREGSGADRPPACGLRELREPNGEAGRGFGEDGQVSDLGPGQGVHAAAYAGGQGVSP